MLKREWGENPLRNTVGVCVEGFCIRYRKIVSGKLRRQDIKMRTEVYMMRVTRPALALLYNGLFVLYDSVFVCIVICKRNV